MSILKCKAKNPLSCRDPRCPEKRYNIKYTLNAIKEAKTRIADLKATGKYSGEAKEIADFSYISSMEWHNELLAESKLTSNEALAWKTQSEAMVGKLLEKKDKLEVSIKPLKGVSKKEGLASLDKLNLKIADALVELKDAEDNYNSTWEGQAKLEEKIASSSDPSLKKEYEKQLQEGAALHAKQVIAMALVDRKRLGSDLPIEVGNAIDLKVLTEEEIESYNMWIDSVRFEKKEVTNRDLIMKQTFTSIYQRVSDAETSLEWRIRPRPNHKGWRIPEYVSKALYVMPNSTDRISIIKFNYNQSYEALKASKKQNDVNSAEYKAWAELKYDTDSIKRFIKR